MKVQELVALTCEAIEVWSEDLASVHSRVGPTHVVGHDQQNVGALLLGVQGEKRSKQKQ